MRYGRYGLSYALLRWGLGLTFAWIGINMLIEPTSWIGYMPEVPPFGLTREGALQLAALLDIAIGTLLILRVWLKVVSGVAAVHLLGILVTQGIDAVVVRDIGLAGAALALFFWPAHYRRHRRLLKMPGLPWPFNRKKDNFD